MHQINTDKNQAVLNSWHRNAAPWVTAVREEQIESRKRCTDQAVIDAVMGAAPASVLDIGCGEGWLCRALAERGVRVAGVDAVPELVDAARASGPGDFRAVTYEQIAEGALDLQVDVAVSNFALIGKESVEGVLHAAPALLKPGGSFVIQTLHPVVACGDAPYIDGWREGSWAGFSDDFTDAPPWYFRTTESWVRLLNNSGLQLHELREPVHPDTGRPASLILIAAVA